MAKNAKELTLTGNLMTIDKKEVKFALESLPSELTVDQLRKLAVPAYKSLVRQTIKKEADSFNAQYEQGWQAVQVLVARDKKKDKGYIPLTGKDENEKREHAKNIVSVVMNTRWTPRDFEVEPITLDELLGDDSE